MFLLFDVYCNLEKKHDYVNDYERDAFIKLQKLMKAARVCGPLKNPRDAYSFDFQ